MESYATKSFGVEEIYYWFQQDSVPGLHVDTAEFLFSDYCEYPAPPYADFSVPDTICLSDSLVAVGQGNAYAHGNLWELTGNGINISVKDSVNFAYKFVEAGSYDLSQTIWYLGCAHKSEQAITVLPPLKVEIERVGDLCEPPAVLKVQSNRALTDAAWSTGEHGAEIQVMQDGNYSVTASDGHCSASDSADVSFISNLLNGESALNLPPDTLVCEDELPFGLLPFSAFANQFSLDNGAFQAAPIYVANEGEHVISVSINGCLFSDSFTLSVQNCQPLIYFPNVFSPNGDGINDEFFPQGINFIASKLMIFSRWGSLIHFAVGEDVAWDGKGATPGTYTYAFDYIGTKTGKRGRIYGTVTVVK
jgi:gliding motility-associated-like protein